MPGPTMEGFGILGEWLYQQDKLAHERLGTPPTAGWMPQDFVGAFGQSLRRFGSVTAIGPAERVTYSRNPTAPRVEATTSAFLETVTEAQWQQLCGAGLAVAQCTASQRMLVQGLLPESTQIYDASFQNLILLDSTRRSQMMLLLELTAVVQGPPFGSFRFTLLGSGINSPLKPQASPFGQELLQKLPNRGGAGQLNTRLLSGSVSLMGEKLTVEEGRLHIKSEVF
ncbi:hypothetical protein [Armatimonas sp.]|uniref:hypothetical protein n=1 Tax=Armatimonas sp. TaxID=1872638 RepID=UPI00286CEEDB|nr:hypothetical protein [Armatimonas sp.]